MDYIFLPQMETPPPSSGAGLPKPESESLCCLSDSFSRPDVPHFCEEQSALWLDALWEFDIPFEEDVLLDIFQDPNFGEPLLPSVPLAVTENSLTDKGAKRHRCDEEDDSSDDEPLILRYKKRCTGKVRASVPDTTASVDSSSGQAPAPAQGHAVEDVAQETGTSPVTEGDVVSDQALERAWEDVYQAIQGLPTNVDIQSIADEHSRPLSREMAEDLFSARRPASMGDRQIDEWLAMIPWRKENLWTVAENRDLARAMMHHFYWVKYEVQSRLWSLLSVKLGRKSGATVKTQWDRYCRAMCRFENRKLEGSVLKTCQLRKKAA